MYEYAYYLIIFYAMMANALGISVGFLGIAMNLALATICLIRRGSGAITRDLTLASPILCAGVFVTIQTLVHQESLMHEYVSPFVPWVLTLIIVKSLSTRPGFIRRFAIVAFLIGLSVLPFLSMNHDDRATLDVQTGLSNPNSLAEWFGFCAVVFTVRSLETRRILDRWISRAIALFGVFIITLTVSRGTLVAFALAVTVAVKNPLKRRFLPVLGIVALGGAALVLGVFDRAIDAYAERGTEETGRLSVWPLIVERVVQSPLTGVGVSGFAIPIGDKSVTPHNGVLFVALGGGVVALLFYFAYWISAFCGARTAAKCNSDSPYLLPLLVFSFVTMLWGSMAFATSYSIASVCLSLNQLAVHAQRRHRGPV